MMNLNQRSNNNNIQNIHQGDCLGTRLMKQDKHINNTQD
jgi:hypothetical protein